MKGLMLKVIFAVALSTLVAGCASYGVVENAPSSGGDSDQSYSLRSFHDQWRHDENALMLAFSGGGTRAAALAYGVLKELRDTPLQTDDGTQRLLDDVHSIMSVSGGSFTAAYYGLHGDGIFDDFEEVFLRRNVEGALIRRVLNPFHWFKRGGRTEVAVDYYDRTVFKGATFSDLRRDGAPMIVINASDLGYGVRFSFVQEYFNLLCSDLSSFPVARAVAASSAVPVLFHPVLVRNYPECGKQIPEFLNKARERAVDNPEMAMVVEGLETFFDRDQRQYAHFVDGGITDNLGLRAIYEVIELVGGMREYLSEYKREPPRRLVLLSVNASANPEQQMDTSDKQPSIEQTISAMSDIQLHRYNAATTELMQRTLSRWAQELSTPEKPVEPYFIQIEFDAIREPERRTFLNRTPTSFSLTEEQVDELIAAGGDLLRHNPEFRRLLADLEADGARDPALQSKMGSESRNGMIAVSSLRRSRLEHRRQYE